MSSQRYHSAKHQLIVVSPSHLIVEGIVGLIDSDEFFAGLLFSRVVFGMILKSESSIGFFDFLYGGIPVYTQNRVVVLEWIGIVVLEEFLFLLSLWAMFIEESFEGGVCILEVIFSCE